VRVPEEAGSGKVKLALSFPGWKEEKVAPATCDILLAEPPPEKRPRKAR
jgi:hypothetical protein